MSVTFYTTNHFWHHYRFSWTAVCGEGAAAGGAVCRPRRSAAEALAAVGDELPEPCRQKDVGNVPPFAGPSAVRRKAAADAVRPCGSGDSAKKERTRAGTLLFSAILRRQDYFIACSTATATATVAPTIGLLPMPRKPISSTCAGTDDEPANWASECIRPIVSVIP